jgi:ribonuclease BN (tRNA processing enzyme)
MDCGSGTLRTLEKLGRQWQEVTLILLSHFHTDHVADLAPLLFALKHAADHPRERPLTVLGPRGLSEHLDALARAHGDFILDPGFPVELTELGPGDSWSLPGRSFTIRSFATLHTEVSLAYRLEAGGGVLGYTGDTGPDTGLGTFMRGCSLLVAECSNPDGTEMGNHLTPATLAQMASLAKPDLLVTVHVYPPLRPEEVPDLIRDRGYPGRILAGRDGLVVNLQGGEAVVEDPIL